MGGIFLTVPNVPPRELLRNLMSKAETAMVGAGRGGVIGAAGHTAVRGCAVPVTAPIHSIGA